MGKEIKITIDMEGMGRRNGGFQFHIEGMGFQGPVCLSEIDKILAQLGGKMIGKKVKPEFKQVVRNLQRRK